MSADCLFCRIVAGTVPAAKVYEDPHVVAIRDINPQAPVHVLLLSRVHVRDLADGVDVDAALPGHLAAAAVRIARTEGLSARGFRLVTNAGADGGQTVMHLHVHLLGGRAMGWPPG
jgi:histidine triad (HIT) family protein